MNVNMEPNVKVNTNRERRTQKSEPRFARRPTHLRTAGRNFQGRIPAATRPLSRRRCAGLRDSGPWFRHGCGELPKRDELEALLNIAGALSLLSDSASGDDAEQSKPDPDIIHAALKKTHVGAANALMIGDTPYDIEAAARAGVGTVAFRCGGWNDEALQGAIAICDGPWELLGRLDGFLTSL